MTNPHVQLCQCSSADTWTTTGTAVPSSAMAHGTWPATGLPQLAGFGQTKIVAYNKHLKVLTRSHLSG